MDNKYSEFLSILEHWSNQGEKFLSDGTRLICPTPHIAPEAWLHVVFPPLEDEKIRDLTEQNALRFLPEDFQHFLGHSNGALIFSYQIAIWGRRRDYSRIGENAWQPYDLLDHNEMAMRPKKSPHTVLYFASEESGAMWCFFEPHESNYRVGKTPREEFCPIQYWDNFWQWLLEQTQELAGLCFCSSTSNNEEAFRGGC